MEEEKGELEDGCYHALLLVRAEAAVLGGELLCHRFGDDIDVIILIY